jgi:acetyl-CoA carboxylase biotin carboxylase subunit
MGKLIAHGTSRDEAIERMTRAITEFSIEGVGTTLPFHQAVMANSSFRQGLVHTRLVEQIVTEMKAPA